MVDALGRGVGRGLSKAINDAASAAAAAGAGGAFGGLGGPGIVNAVIKTAARAIGQWYLWGGSRWPRFDCSGLMQWAFGQHGIRLPRVSRDQARGGRAGTGARGDLVFFDRGNVHHVGLVLGGRMMLNAPHTGARVRVQSYAGRSVNNYRSYFGGRAVAGHAVADDGAWLPPRSTTMVTNRTGQWEPVGPPGGGRSIQVTVPLTIYGEVTPAQRAQMHAIAEDMGEQVAAELSDALARRGSGV
jgi:hypothetical protein